jgi:hypothetical protein
MYTEDIVFAKYINEDRLDFNIPNTAKIDGVWVSNIRNSSKSNKDILYKLGYLPFISSEDRPEIPEDKILITKYYIDSESNIIRNRYELQDYIKPPRTLSKLRLFDTLYTAGLWDAVNSVIQSDIIMKTRWELAVNLNEDDSMVQGMIQLLKKQLNTSDEKIEEILSASEAI